MSRSVHAWAALLLVLFALTLGCAREPGPLWADPGVIRFDVERTEVAVEIHNVSATARPIGEFALTGEDWATLRVVDDELPRTVPRDGAVVIRLAISRASYRTRPGEYRSGRANLEFRSDQHAFAVPIEFVGTAERRPGAPPAWLGVLGLALIGLAATLIPARGARGVALATRLLSPSVTTARARLGVAGALAALLLLAAAIPLGAGVCRGRYGARVGAAELRQCRAGLGGFEPTLLPAEPGLWWWVIALMLIAAGLGLVRRRAGEPASALALGFVRAFGLALALVSLVIGLAPPGAAPIELALAQLRGVPVGTMTMPAWGLVAQPIACAAVVGLAIALPRPGRDPMLAALERFERLIASALIITLYLGAWTIPRLSSAPIPPLTHAGTLAVELLSFAVKLALVDLALRRLGELLAGRGVSQAQLLRAHARWTVPILLVHLLGVALWRIF